MKIPFIKSHAAKPVNVETDNKRRIASPSRHVTDESLFTSAVHFAETRGTNTGMRLMKELNVNDINRHHKSEADKILNLSEGTALFLAFDQKVYKTSDPFVKNAEIRMAITKHLQEKNPHKTIFWVENVGVAEPGSGMWATVPVFASHGLTLTAGFGFSVGTILRYRTCMPVIGNKGNKAKLAMASPKALPVNAQGAQQMEAGQEFELSGQGKVRGDANMAIRYGVGVGVVAMAGISENIGPIATAAAEYGINVLSLGQNKVRVTIRKINQESLAMVSNTAVGLIFPSNKLFPGNFGWPQVGHGLLKYFAEHKGPPNFEAYLTDYTSLGLNCSLTHTHKHLHICSYDIDLSNSQAAAAYDSLMRLDVAEADALVATKNGVTKADLEETQNTNKSAVRLALCTEKLFLVEALKYESHGELFDGQGHHKIYRDAAYKKHVENILTGHHDALWEAVEIIEDGEKAKTYYHFNYQKEDFFTRQSEISTFFTFAKALNIKHAEDAQEELIDMHSYQKLLSSADDTKLEVDLYFTNEGVARLRNMLPEDMIRVFLKMRSKFDPWVGSMPLFSSDKSIQEAGNLFFYKYRMARRHKVHRLKIHEIRSAYFHQFGRDIKKDFGVIRKAERFAQLSRYLIDVETDENKLGKFFTALGKSKRPHYTQVIPALAEIAGEDNVLIHTLSASGGGISLKSVDEGALTHPRQEMVKLCLKNGTA